LTPRQLEVLLLLAEGASQSDIAEQLHVSPSTVRKHIERILRLLNVRSRSEAIAWAFREGINQMRCTKVARLRGSTNAL
jgi:DNA-binding NarL/FixJ family response regulator